MSATLADLLARVQAATGPDREIDRLIMALSYVRERRHIGTSCWDDAGDTCCPGARHLDDVWADPIADRWRTTAVDGFDFTSSVDAALSLVERLVPGMEFSLSTARHRKGWAVKTWLADDKHSGRLFDAPTPALALLAAMLKALQNAAPSGDGTERVREGGLRDAKNPLAKTEGQP